MTEWYISRSSCFLVGVHEHTMQSDDAEDEHNGQSHDNDRVDLETGRLISVQPWNLLSALVQTQTVM